MNASQAGAGQLEVVLKSDDYRLPVKVSDKGQGVFKVSFVPTEARQHCVYVYFSKEVVPGGTIVQFNLFFWTFECFSDKKQNV